MSKEVLFLASPEVWQHGHGPQHPLKPERLERTYALLEAYGALEAANVRVEALSLASEAELGLFHTADYIAAVRDLSRGEFSVPPARYNFGPGDNPVFSGMYESEGRKVGSALQGAAQILAGKCEVAFSYSGGLHHGGPNFASGFCVFNDAAVAIHWLLEEGLRVAYVDIDVHHGDGVQDAFYDDDRVLTISLHQSGRTLFPGTGFVTETGAGAGQGFAVNVPFPPFTADEDYLWAFHEVVPPLIRRFEPDILVSQLGVDTHFQDPLASLMLTTRGQTALFEALADLNLPWLALGGGGYNLEVVPRAWTLAFGVMSGQELPNELPAAFREEYGGETLRDREGPRLDEARQEHVRREVEAVVAEAKKLHGLGTSGP